MGQSAGVTHTFDNRRIKVVNTFYSNHDRARGFNSKSKQETIEKENDLILKKIIQVNNRRNQSLGSNPATARNYSHNSLSSLKKSLQTINSQNQKLAQKLVTTDSSLRQDKMGESYRKHLERKERLKKYAYDEEAGMIVPKKIRSLQKFKMAEAMRYEDEGYGSRYRLASNTSRHYPDNEER